MGLCEIESQYFRFRQDQFVHEKTLLRNSSYYCMLYRDLVNTKFIFLHACLSMDRVLSLT